MNEDDDNGSLVAGKSINTPRTVLGTPTEPLSEEKCEKHTEQWALESLERIWYLSIDNEKIARALCDKTILTAHCNNELFGHIKDNLKKDRGRPSNSLPDWLFLFHYAHAVHESDGNYQEARRKFIGYLKKKNPDCLEGDLIQDMIPSIENEISRKVAAYRNGKIKTPFDGNKFPVWAETIIQARIARGDKNKKRN